MRVQLLGGPLDGSSFESPHRAIEPEVMYFADSRRLHRYVYHAEGEFVYQSPDIIIDGDRAFDLWWQQQREKGELSESSREVAYLAWHEALARL